MAARIPNDLLHKYPPQTHGEFECKFWVNKCRECDARFKPHEVLCSHCGKPRKRCGAKVMTDTDCCRAHMPRGTLTIHNLVAGRFTEQAIEEVIENEDRSLDSEMALAKLVLAKILEDAEVNDRIKLKSIGEYFNIALARKKVETGEDLNIRYDDKTADAIRRRFKMLISTFQGALDEFVKDPQIKQQIMERVKLGSKLVGKHTAVGPDAQLPGYGPRAGTRHEL